MARRKSLETLISKLGQEKMETVYTALHGFSKNLVDIVIKDDRYENLYPFLGTTRALYGSSYVTPEGLETNIEIFESQYQKNQGQKSVIFDCYPDTLEAAAVPADIPAEFIENINVCKFPALAHVLGLCKKKHDALANA